MNNKSLQDKVAVVTGAGRGIGRAVALALAQEGCALALGGRDLTTLAGAARNMQASQPPLVQACDVRDASSVEKFFRAVKRRFGRVDFLINNAGVAQPTRVADELPVEAWRNAIDTNLTGVFLCVRAALPLMSRGGVIVNNLSVAAIRAFPGLSAYTASKHGAMGFTNTLREELRPRGIRVVALLLGATITDIWEQFLPNADRAAMMSPETAAASVIHTLKVPENAGVDEIRLLPIGGTVSDKSISISKGSGTGAGGKGRA